MNIFLYEHKERSGKVQPIISMDAEHLCNYINFYLVKEKNKKMKAIRDQMVRNYAPVEMDEKVRKSLGLKKITQADLDIVERQLEEFETEYIQEAIEEIWQYIIVGVVRDDTREGVARILQEATGVNNQIVLPNLTRQESPLVLASGDYDQDVIENDWNSLMGDW